MASPQIAGVLVPHSGNGHFQMTLRSSSQAMGSPSSLLTPVPSAVRTLLADFHTLRDAGEAVSAIIRSGIVPAALEMMDRSCIAAVEASIYAAGYPTDAGAVLLVEVDGQHDRPLEHEASEIESILREHGARSVSTATDEDTRTRLWHGRKKA